MNSTAIHFRAGTHFGRYLLLEDAGEGPLARVYLAEDTRLGRRVALKVLKPEFLRSFPLPDLPEEEIGVTALLRHSGIVPLYGTGVEGGHPYCSMALMPGGNLRQNLEKGLSPDQAVGILSQVARALAFAHGKGINHHGIKPENILFRRDGSALLSDFHVFKVHGFGTGTLSREPCPHPHYISPEQIENAGKQFGRADLYALGIVFYEMLTGEVPFRGEESARQHIEAPIPTLPSHLSPYQPLLDRMLAKKPSERFSDVNRLIQALDQLGGNSRKVVVLPILKKKEKAPEPPPAEEQATEDVAAVFSLEAEAEIAPPPAPLEPSVPSPPAAAGAPSPAPGKGKQRWTVAAFLLTVLAAAAFWAGGRPSAPPLAPPAPLPAVLEAETSLSEQEQPGLESLFSEALALAVEGQRDEAIVRFRELAAQFPFLSESFNNLAVLQAAAGDLKAARQTLEAGIRANPVFATMLENLNTIELEQALGEGAPPHLQMISRLASPFNGRHVPVQEGVAPLLAGSALSAEAPASTTTAPEDEIAALLAHWADAWSAQDFPRYLSFYGRGFRPANGESRPQWEQTRLRNLTTPAHIRVALADLHFSRLEDGRLSVLAIQDYRSNLFRDRVLKSFEIGREDGVWVIIGESTLAPLR